MPTDWDYAKLSKAAKEKGGPQKLVDELIDFGKELGKAEGRKDMRVYVELAGVIGILGGALLLKIYQLFNEKKEISPEAIEETKVMLINGIEKYDSTHTNEVDAIDDESISENDHPSFLDSLEQRTYDDCPDSVFYVCPICGNEYLESFLYDEDGEVMCIDCWSKRNKE